MQIKLKMKMLIDLKNKMELIVAYLYYCKIIALLKIKNYLY